VRGEVFGAFCREQLHSLTTTLSKALQSMRRLAVELAKPGGRFTEAGIRHKIARWLAGAFVSELVHYQLEKREGGWHLQFDFDNSALERLLTHRLGRTTLLTNRMDWTAEQIVAGYSGQQHIERVFRGLKDGDWLGWGPMYHWTDSKDSRACVLQHAGISLLQYIHKKAQAAWAGLSMEQLLEELRQIQQFTLLYPPQGEKGPNRVATVLSKQTLPQQCLAKELGLIRCVVPQVGNTLSPFRRPPDSDVYHCRLCLSSKLPLAPLLAGVHSTCVRVRTLRKRRRPYLCMHASSGL